VLDVCIFTQWVRDIEFEQPDGRQVRFEFRNPKDFNVYGISLRHIDLQRQYAATLARRLRRAGNIIYDLANETYVKDPGEGQIDPRLLHDHSIPAERGTRRDTLLFRAWAGEIASAMRHAGAQQIMMPGYMFTGSNGGDNYLGNRHAPFEPWHAYSSYAATVGSLSYEDPSCSDRPMLLEEFGQAGWNSAAHYQAMVHAALAAGAAGAMSYEWGVRWLAPELSFDSLPLRDFLSAPKDPRFFSAVRGVVKDWSLRSTGINPSPSGFLYGSIYSGTPFPAAAAVDLGRFGRMGKGMERAALSESVYIVIPSAPRSTEETMAKVADVVGQLSARHTPFGILQQDCLASIPSEARVLILPDTSPPAEKDAIEKLLHPGIAIIDASVPGWIKSPMLPRIPINPAGVNLLVRDVPGGRLYALENDKPISSVQISLRSGKRMSLGLEKYALVRESGAAIDWVEGTGRIREDGTLVASIENGRVILASGGGEDLSSAESVRLLASEPTTIRFPRRISSSAIVVDGGKTQLQSAIAGSTLTIDDQLVHYVIEVNFQ
jgi:hypothetical protein